MADLTATIVLDHVDFGRKLRQVEVDQVPFATAMALNDTAQDVLDAVQDRMDSVFDRPTRFTKNAFMVWRANKKTLEAAVQERPSVGSRHYLKVQETGGARPQTGLERLVTGLVDDIGALGAIVHAEAARLNQYGNWAPGERNQVVKALKGFGGGRTAYFVPPRGSSLSPGVWKRTGKGKREKLVKVAHLVPRAPVYDDALEFLDGAERVFDVKFWANWEKAFARAMQTAR